MKPINISESRNKQPVRATVDLNTALDTYRGRMDPFYQNKNIKKITEDELFLGEDSLCLTDASIDPVLDAVIQKESTHGNQINPRTDLANAVLKEIAKPQKPGLIPKFQASLGLTNINQMGEDDEDNLPLRARRSFEYKESDVINDLYDKHFMSKSNA